MLVNISIGTMLCLGIFFLLVGVGSGILRLIGVPVSSLLVELSLFCAGLYQTVIGVIAWKCEKWRSIPLLLIGLEVSVCALVATRMTALLFAVGWNYVLAIALTQMPLVAIFVELWYGDSVRKNLVAALKKEKGWNNHKTQFARDIARRLPISALAVYSSTVSITATALLLDIGVEKSVAIAAAFLLAVVPGTAFYYFHPAIRELQAFTKADNPNEFMKTY